VYVIVSINTAFDWRAESRVGLREGYLVLLSYFNAKYLRFLMFAGSLDVDKYVLDTN
jgi:hypothetical protein